MPRPQTMPRGRRPARSAAGRPDDPSLTRAAATCGVRRHGASWRIGRRCEWQADGKGTRAAGSARQPERQKDIDTSMHIAYARPPTRRPHPGPRAAASCHAYAQPTGRPAPKGETSPRSRRTVNDGRAPPPVGAPPTASTLAISYVGDRTTGPSCPTPSAPTSPVREPLQYETLPWRPGSEASSRRCRPAEGH